MILKTLIFVLYAIIFTYCYYFLNKKISNRWILIVYPLFFCASIYPIKIIFDTLVSQVGKSQAGEWLKVMLFAVAVFSLFNFVYGVVNLMVNRLADYQQQLGNPYQQPAKWYLANRANIMNMYHFFFYTGGVILYGIALYKSGIS